MMANLYIYNIRDKSRTKIDNIPQNARGPKVLNSNEFFYSAAGIWKYNLQTSLQVNLFNNAVSLWINDNNIFYQEIIPCAEIDCRGYDIGSSKIFNIDKNSSETVNIHGEEFYSLYK